jgi:HPt (histidine-containing phosphotransfer) domain-containing protein
MALYSHPLPAGWGQNDAHAVAAAVGLTVDGSSVKPAGTINLICLTDQDPSLVAAWRAALTGSPPQTARRIAETLDQALAAAMAAMQQIVDAPDLAAGTLTAAQLSNACRSLQTAVKVEARLLRRLVRHVRGDMTGSD